jgi:hypothetical protein
MHTKVRATLSRSPYGSLFIAPMKLLAMAAFGGLSAVVLLGLLFFGSGSI